MTRFNFKSAICTSREQSERLLALSLKKETADCVWIEMSKDDWRIGAHGWKEHYSIIKGGIAPAWSLGRLWEILPHTIMYNDVMYYKQLRHAGVIYNSWHINNDIIISKNSRNPYETLIDAIEWLIKHGFRMVGRCSSMMMTMTSHLNKALWKLNL